MLSGNGRHRRPRQAPALLVAAGVTGSAIAIPLLGAGSASAADGTAWDRVAECESGGSWSQNTGNGYYGGLQLTQDDWESYGGLDYAPSADQASRGQQIAVAEKILADQGVGAWRTCGLLAGLGGNAPAADAGAGTPGSSETPGDAPESGGPLTSSPSATAGPSSGAGGETKSPEATDGPTAGSGRTAGPDAGSGDGADTGPGASPSPSASASASADPKSDETDKAGRNGGSSAGAATEGAGTGRHRGASAEEGKEKDRESDASGRHASRGLDAWGGGSSGDSYTVREGDNLSSIADSLAYDGGWRALYTVNEQLIGADPDFILPGQELEVEGGTDRK